MAVNVIYHEKIKNLQEIKHDSEMRRLELEKQLNQYMKSDNRLGRLKAVRLQNYWKKLCEDEKKSAWRNEQLLKDIERVENDMNSLSNRRERLQHMKKQYEEYIERVYPQWKEKVLALKQFKEQKATMHVQSYVETAAALQNFSLNTGNMHAQPFTSTPARHDALGKEFRLPVEQNISGIYAPNQNFPPNALVYPNARNQLIEQNANFNQQRVPGPYNIDATTQAKRPSVAGKELMPQYKAHDIKEVSYRDEVVFEPPNSFKTSKTKGDMEVSPNYDDGMDSNTDDDIPAIEDNVMQQGKEVAITSPRPARSQSVESIVSRKSSASSGKLSKRQLAETDRDIYPQANVTLEGLYNLLFAVQQCFPVSSSLDEFYRSSIPAESVFADICENANKGTTLSHVGGSALSMVLIDQLPLVCANCEGNCVLSDSIILNPPQNISMVAVKYMLHPATQTLWEKLVDHFIKLLKYSIMQVHEIADVFATLLIRSTSQYEQAARELITDLLESLPREDLNTSLESTGTLSLPLSPKGKPVIDVNQHSMQTVEETEIKHPVILQNTQPSFAPTVDLTQTEAYRQILGDTASTQKSITYEHSDDESTDSVERALKAHSSATSPRGNVSSDGEAKPKQNVMIIPSASQEEKDISDRSADDPASAIGNIAASVDVAKSVTSLGSSGRSSKKAAFMYGDSDTDEEIHVPGGKDAKKKKVPTATLR